MLKRRAAQESRILARRGRDNRAAAMQSTRGELTGGRVPSLNAMTGADMGPYREPRLLE